MKKQGDTVKDATEPHKRLKSGSMPIQKEKKKLPDSRGRVVRKEASEKPSYVPTGKVVRRPPKGKA